MKPVSTPDRPDPRWKGLYRAAVAAVAAMLVIMVAQIVIFAAWPPPQTVAGFFELFQRNRLLGLLSMDLLYILNNSVLMLIYLALYAALRKGAESASLAALVLGVVGVAAYFASNTGFEMLAISGQYAAAAGEAQRTALLGAGEALLAIYRGTAFDTYYVLNAAALLIFAVVMLRGRLFTRATGWWGLAAGVLMIVPSTAGALGLVFSLASLVPWAVFAVMIARQFRRFAALAGG